jgi:hypothetical protein
MPAVYPSSLTPQHSAPRFDDEENLSDEPIITLEERHRKLLEELGRFEECGEKGYKCVTLLISLHLLALLIMQSTISSQVYSLRC